MNRLKPDGPNLKPTECPYCHKKIDCTTWSSGRSTGKASKELGWLDDRPSMPTVMMVRVVLDHVFGKE